MNEKLYESYIKHVFPILPDEFTDVDMVQYVINLRNQGVYNMFQEVAHLTKAVTAIKLGYLYLYLCNQGLVRMFIRGKQIVYIKTKTPI